MTNPDETYIVFVTRDRTETTAVRVEAPYLEAAEEMALKFVVEIQDTVNWKLDGPPPINRLYVSGVEKPLTEAGLFNEEEQEP